MVDPRLDTLRTALRRRRPLRLERPAGYSDAAVALVIRPRDEMELLLIRRAENEGDPWSGHMALPGGRRHVADDDLFVTACRETEEETGVPLANIGTLFGGLDEIAPGTTLLPPVIIAPFVAVVPSSADAWPASPEVAGTLWIPLPALRDEGAASQLLVELSDGTRAFPTFNYRGHVIWGLTHRILVQFLEIAGEAGL